MCGCGLDLDQDCLSRSYDRISRKVRIVAGLLRIISRHRTLALISIQSEVLMPHDRSAVIEQLRAHLTQQQFNSVVIHSYCRNAEALS